MTTIGNRVGSAAPGMSPVIGGDGWHAVTPDGIGVPDLSKAVEVHQLDHAPDTKDADVYERLQGSHFQTLYVYDDSAYLKDQPADKNSQATWTEYDLS